MSTIYYYIMKGLGADIYNKIRPRICNSDPGNTNTLGQHVRNDENAELDFAYTISWITTLFCGSDAAIRFLSHDNSWKKMLYIGIPLTTWSIYHGLVAKYNIIKYDRTIENIKGLTDSFVRTMDDFTDQALELELDSDSEEGTTNGFNEVIEDETLELSANSQEDPLNAAP